MRCIKLKPGDCILLWQKGFQTKHKIVDQWKNTTYEIVKKLDDIPVYKIHELPKPREDNDGSHALCTRVLHHNMLFPLVETETDILEYRNDSRENPDHKACTPQGRP